MKPPIKLTTEEIDACRTDKGGFTRAQLAAWGVPWPPPTGWRDTLLQGKVIPGTETATAQLPSDCLEAILLRKLVMAVIENGRSDILSAIPELNRYYNQELPTVADVIGDRPQHAIITGGITFDDNVYSFKCIRAVTR